MTKYKRSDLRAYQEGVIQFAKDTEKCGLFLDMGLGKTVSALTVISDYLDDLMVSKVLVVSTLKVANTVWLQQAQEWEHLKHLRIGVFTSEKKRLIPANIDKYDVFVTNVDSLLWIIANMPWRWDMLVVDESTLFKNPSAKRTKAIKKKTKHFYSTLLLTGTPSPKGAEDLWSQIYLLDNGERLGRTMTEFRRRYYTQGYQHYVWKLNPGSFDTIKGKIKDIAVSMESKDYLQLPDRIDVVEKLTLPDKARAQYRELQKEFLLGLEDGTIIEAGSVAAQLNKLLQMCNGQVYIDEGKGTHELHDEKLSRLREIVDDNPSENFLVGYSFTSDRDRILKAFPEAVALSKDGSELEAWNKGEIRMLVAHPQSAGHGINAQHGGSVVVWYGLTWSLELYQQFNARLHRQGQTKPVRIVHLVMEKTAEEQVLSALKAKAQGQQELVDYLRFDPEEENNLQEKPKEINAL